MSTTFRRARSGLYLPRYLDTILPDAPLWVAKMDETSGSTMVDVAGGGRNGSYVNSPTLNGLSGVTFNGTNQYANVPGASWMNVTDYTFEFALKTTGNNAYILDRDSAVAPNKIWAAFVRIAGTLAFTTYTTGNVTEQLNGAATVNDGTERHIALVKSGSSKLIYVGGTQDASGTGTSFQTSATQDINIARRGDGSSFLPATIRRAAFYGSALSATRIAAHAAAM